MKQLIVGQRPERERWADLARRRMLAEADRLYHPCWCGVHVCGASPDEAAMTVGQIPARNEAEARAIFAACKAEAEAQPGEPQDYVVDLNIDRDNLHVEDFPMTRQMLQRCLTAGRLAREQLNTIQRPEGK